MPSHLVCKTRFLLGQKGILSGAMGFSLCQEQVAFEDFRSLFQQLESGHPQKLQYANGGAVRGSSST